MENEKVSPEMEKEKEVEEESSTRIDPTETHQRTEVTELEVSVKVVLLNFLLVLNTQ